MRRINALLDQPADVGRVTALSRAEPQHATRGQHLRAGLRQHFSTFRAHQNVLDRVCGKVGGADCLDAISNQVADLEGRIDRYAKRQQALEASQRLPHFLRKADGGNRVHQVRIIHLEVTVAHVGDFRRSVTDKGLAVFDVGLPCGNLPLDLATVAHKALGVAAIDRLAVDVLRYDIVGHVRCNAHLCGGVKDLLCGAVVRRGGNQVRPVFQQVAHQILVELVGSAFQFLPRRLIDKTL